MNCSAFRYVSVILVLTFLFSAATAPCAFAEDSKGVELKTSITGATVYKGQSQVRRSGTLSLKKGKVRIICDDLPFSFEASSLQVEGHGSANVSIVGTDVIRMQEDLAETPRFIELVKKLEALETRRDSIGIEINALQVRLQFVEQLGRLPMQQNQAEEFPKEIFQVEGWKALMDFLQNERTGADAKVYALNKKKRSVEDDIRWIKRALGIMKQGTRSGNRVAIDCAVESAGELTVDLTYIIRGSNWVPEYRISFDPEVKQVALVYNARLSQTTGEDWKRVDLTLSTAAPHAGAAPPELQPHYLGQRMSRAMKSLSLDEIEDMAGVSVHSASIDSEPEQIRAGHAEAQIASSQFAASFKVPAKVDLASGADSKRIRITEGKMDAALSLYTAPRLRDDVFVRGMVTNSLGAPILTGQAEVYIDSGAAGGGKSSTFVGRQQLFTFADGQEFPLHLGVDQDVKAVHKLEKREYVEKEGKKWKKIRYHYLIKIENFKKEAAEIVLQDRIPVSTMKEIKVEKVDFSIKPDESREDGIMTWNLTPAAGGKIEIRIAYTIVFPGEWPEHSLNLE